MKINLSLVFLLMFTCAAVAQQKMFWTTEAGFFRPQGELGQWQRSGTSVGASLHFSFPRTRNQLWLLVNARALEETDVEYTVFAGESAFEALMGNSLFVYDAKLRYHLRTGSRWMPFIQTGGGMLFKHSHLRVNDPRQTSQTCYPPVFTSRERNSTTVATIGGGIMLFSLNNLMSPQKKGGNISFVLSAQYTQGLNPVTAYPTKPVYNAGPAITPEGKTVMARFQHPLTGQDINHPMTSAYRAHVRIFEMNAGLMIGGDIVKKKKKQANRSPD